MCPKERNDHVAQFSKPRHAITAEVRLVIVMSPIVRDMTTPENLSELFQNATAPNRLHNRELRLYLPAKRRLTVSKDGTAETAFPIDETGNPSAVPESFLLVFRTHRIVTSTHDQKLQTTCNKSVLRGRSGGIHRVFQHIADYSPHRHRYGGQHPSAC
jgi:hypothetical protein